MGACRLVAGWVASVAMVAGVVSACDPGGDDPGGDDGGGASDPAATPTAVDSDDGDATEPASAPGPRRSPSACVPVGDPLGDALPQGKISVKAKPPGETGMSRSNEVTVDIGQATVEANGRFSQSATVSLDHRLTLKGEKDLKKAGINGEVFIGQEVSYGLAATPSQLRQLDWALPPTPLDPSAIPEGGSVTMDATTYAGLGLEAEFRNLRAAWGRDTGVRVVSAVTRLPDRKVQVLVGPEPFVRDSIRLGFGTDDASVWFEHSRERARPRMEQAVFDLDSGPGRLRYYAMVLGGVFPNEDDDGVSERASVEGVEYSSANEVQLQLGELTAGLDIGGDELSYLMTDHTDGRRDYDISYQLGDRAILSHDEYAADGARQPDHATYQLRMAEVRADALNAYNAAYANHTSDIGQPQNFVLTFTHDDFETMRSQAPEVLAQRVNLYSQYDDRFPDLPNDATASQLVAWLEEKQAAGDTRALLRLKSLPEPGVYQAYDIATAPSDFAILYRIFLGGGSTWTKDSLRWLGEWSQAVADMTGNGAFGLGEVTCVGGTVRSSTEVETPPSDSRIDPCLLGSWEQVSLRQTTQLTFQPATMTGWTGRRLTFHRDGTEVVRYDDATPLVATSDDHRLRSTYRGVSVYQVRTEGERLIFEDVDHSRASVTRTYDGVRSTFEPNDLSEPVRYTCTDSRHMQRTEGYRATFRRLPGGP